MDKLRKQFNKLLTTMKHVKHKEIVFFCAGNYKIWYDDFSSVFAEKLKSIGLRCFIYGGKGHSITACNIVSYMDFINQKHPGAYIIVVDNLLTTNAAETGELVIDDVKRCPAGLINNRQFGDLFILFKIFPYSYNENINVYKNFIIKCLIKYINLYKFCINSAKICKI